MAALSKCQSTHIHLYFTWGSFKSEDVDAGKRIFQNACLEDSRIENTIYRKTWTVLGSPENVHPEFGRLSFHDIQGHHSTCSKKAQAIEHYFKEAGFYHPSVNLESVCINFFWAWTYFKSGDAINGQLFFKEACSHAYTYQHAIHKQMWVVKGSDPNQVSEYGRLCIHDIHPYSSTTEEKAQAIENFLKDYQFPFPTSFIFPFIHLYAAKNHFNTGDVENGTLNFKKAAPNCQNGVFGKLWEIKRKPYGNPRFGEHCFFNENFLSSSLLEKARSIELFLFNHHYHFLSPYNEDILSYEQLAEVVFIGAGPVGLWTAILTKVRNATTRIFMIEKYYTYGRDQELHIDSDVFKEIPEDSDLNEVVKTFKEKKLIPIQDIESTLERIARAKGIYILKGQSVTDPLSLIPRFPKARAFVAADGTRSVIRQHFFKNTFSFNEVISYQAHVQMNVQEPAQSILFGRDPWKWNRHTWQPFRAMTNPILEESVSKKNDRQLRVIFQISQTTYSAINAAKRKTPFYLNDTRIPQALRNDINLWRGVKKHHYGETTHSSTVSLSAVKLHAYASKEFVQHVWIDSGFTSVPYYFVGDAAAGYPYRQGFNFGMASGIELSKTLTYLASASDYNTYLQNSALEKLKTSRKKYCDIQKELYLGRWGCVPGFDYSENNKQWYRNLVS